MAKSKADDVALPSNSVVSVAVSRIATAMIEVPLSTEEPRGFMPRKFTVTLKRHHIPLFSKIRNGLKESHAMYSLPDGSTTHVDGDADVMHYIFDEIAKSHNGHNAG